MIACPRCKKILSSDDFNYRPNGKRRSACKICEAHGCKIWYEKQSDEYKERKKCEKRLWNKLHRAKTSEARDKWIAEHPEEHRKQATIRARRHNQHHRNRMNARAWITRAKKKGLIPDEPCVFCGTLENIHRCHVDYDYPKFTFPACRKHHYDYDYGRIELPDEIEKEFQNQLTL